MEEGGVSEDDEDELGGGGSEVGEIDSLDELSEMGGGSEAEGEGETTGGSVGSTSDIATRD